MKTKNIIDELNKIHDVYVGESLVKVFPAFRLRYVKYKKIKSHQLDMIFKHMNSYAELIRHAENDFTYQGMLDAIKDCRVIVECLRHRKLVPKFSLTKYKQDWNNLGDGYFCGIIMFHDSIRDICDGLVLYKIKFNNKDLDILGRSFDDVKMQVKLNSKH